MICRVTDHVSFACLAVLVVVPAWIFGGIEATTQSWLLMVALVGVAAATLHLLLATPADDQNAAIPWLAYALIGAIAFGGLQLLPLHSKLLQKLSPTAYGWWTELASFSSDALLPVSIYPAGTRKDMSTLTLVLLSMILASLAANSSARRLSLCAMLAINGALMSFMGMVQQLTSPPGTIYWSIPLTLGGYPFAGFVNRNNAAGYLNMCLGLSIGFLLWSVTRYSMTMNHPLSTARRIGRRIPRSRIRMTEVLASLDTVSILAMTATVFIAAGVLSTLSRGGALALLGAAIVTAVITATVYRGFVSLGTTACVTIVGIVLTIWLGRAELLQKRFSVLFDGDAITENEGRLLNWNDALAAFQDFPLVGTGMGTYRYAYEPYETRATSAWFVHAENQYIESAVEGGVVGLGLLLICLALAGWTSYRLLFVVGDAETNAFGFAALFALATQMIHALFDFGLYLPSNSILLAVICGAAGSFVRSQRRFGERWFCRAEKWLSVVVALLALSAGALGLREMYASSLIERTGRQVRRMELTDLQSTDIIRSHMQGLQTALEGRPDDADGQHRLARLWIMLYRLEAVAQMQGNLPSLSTEELLGLTAIETLFLRAQDPGNRDRLLQQPLVKNHLRRAWDRLQLARDGCPVMAKVHLLLAQLTPLFGEPGSLNLVLANALRTSPGDPDNLYDIGLLKLYSGQTDEAIELWRQTLADNKTYRDRMITIGTRTLGPMEFYRRLMVGMPKEIIEIARNEYRGDENRNLRLELAALAEKQLLDADWVVDSRDGLLGDIHMMREDWQLAAESYEKALIQSGQNLEWRYELAKVYFRLGNLSKAKWHAQLGRRLAGSTAQRFQLLLKQIQSQEDRSKLKSRPRS